MQYTLENEVREDVFDWFADEYVREVSITHSHPRSALRCERCHPSHISFICLFSLHSSGAGSSRTSATVPHRFTWWPRCLRSRHLLRSIAGYRAPRIQSGVLWPSNPGRATFTPAACFVKTGHLESGKRWITFSSALPVLAGAVGSRSVSAAQFSHPEPFVSGADTHQGAIT